MRLIVANSWLYLSFTAEFWDSGSEKMAKVEEREAVEWNTGQLVRV